MNLFIYTIWEIILKKWSRNFYRRKFIQYNNRGINVFFIFWGGWGTVV